jgi:hypothetical protein
MEIRIDGDRVLVCFGDRGPYRVLTEDGPVTEEFVPRGFPVLDDEPAGGYEDGYDDGYDKARTDAIAAVDKAAEPLTRDVLAATMRGLGSPVRPAPAPAPAPVAPPPRTIVRPVVAGDRL